MTPDVVINNIINDLCQRFNVASSELIPKLQAYWMMMSKFGAITAGIFCVTLAIGMIFLYKKDSDLADILCALIGIVELISIAMLIYNIYIYIGWKYAPEIKSIEYIMYLF